MKTAIIYSCFLYNQWDDIVKNQLDRLKSSDYYLSGGEIHIVALGLPNQLILLKLICGKYERIKINFFTNLKYPVEGYGFQYMYNLCLQGYDYVGFVHSKGVSKHRNVPITNWRKCMEYFVIDHALDAIEILNETNFNCFGVLFDIFDLTKEFKINNDLIEKHRVFIFPGNFFWVKSKWFITMPEPPLTTDRFFYERYLGCFEDVMPCYPFIKKYQDTGPQVTYHEPVFEEEYINLDIQKYAEFYHE